jgi:hypothetical protein
MKTTNKYELTENNFIRLETVKKQIVFGNMLATPENNFRKWTTRFNGKYKKTAPYSIDIDGTIYTHFNPKYTSNILNNSELDKRSIVILIENNGWLTKNVEKNQFIDWFGNIYNRCETVLEKKWRGQTYWAPYTESQIAASINLVNYLCDEFNIPKYVIPHNTKIENVNDFEGILYKSNIEKHYTDLTPAWPCENFKYKLELNETTD